MVKKCRSCPHIRRQGLQWRHHCRRWLLAEHDAEICEHREDTDCRRPPIRPQDRDQDPAVRLCHGWMVHRGREVHCWGAEHQRLVTAVHNGHLKSPPKVRRAAGPGDLRVSRKPSLAAMSPRPACTGGSPLRSCPVSGCLGRASMR